MQTDRQPHHTEWQRASNGVRYRINTSQAAKPGTPKYIASMHETQRTVEQILMGWAERNKEESPCAH